METLVNGSCLTPFAERLMGQFDKLQTQVNHQSDDFYESLMGDSLTQG